MPRSFGFLAALTICCCAPSRLAPRAPAPAPDDGAIARVEHGLIAERRVAGESGGWSIAERLRFHHVPAVSVAVIHDRRVAWARAWGQKDVRTGQRADERTLFQAASISKMVTALGALREADAGKVALDEDINRALTTWKVPANDFTRAHPVTLAELLAHTAGTNVHSVVGHAPGTPLPTTRQILDGEPPANTPPVRVEAEPGKAFRYSGGGSLIVQQLIEDLARAPFDRAMQELVLAPLGMTHSSFAVPLPAEALPLRATPHDWDDTPLPELVYAEAAPAGLWTTPSDIAQLLAEVQRALDGRSTVISRRAAELMTTAVAPIGVPGASTGLGTFVERHGDAVYFGHDGLNDGFLAMSRAIVGGGDGAVVMCNGAGCAQLIFEIMRSIAVEYRWPGWLAPPIVPAAIEPARLAACAGRFSDGVNRPLTLVVRDGRLEARAPFAAPRELIPIGAGELMARDGTRFELRADGREVVETPPDDGPIVRARHAEADEPLALLEAGRDAEALARARALLPAHAAALSADALDDVASELLDRQWDLPRALSVFRLEAALHPDSPYAVAGVALALLRAGRKAEAAPVVARARALAASAQLEEIPRIYLGVRLSRLTLLSGS